MTDLKGKTLFITGASRGIGKTIALRAAKDGASIAIAAIQKLRFFPHSIIAGEGCYLKSSIFNREFRLVRLRFD